MPPLFLCPAPGVLCLDCTPRVGWDSASGVRSFLDQIRVIAVDASELCSQRPLCIDTMAVDFRSQRSLEIAQHETNDCVRRPWRDPRSHRTTVLGDRSAVAPHQRSAELSHVLRDFRTDSQIEHTAFDDVLCDHSARLDRHSRDQAPQRMNCLRNRRGPSYDSANGGIQSCGTSISREGGSQQSVPVDSAFRTNRFKQLLEKCAPNHGHFGFGMAF
jgi:hypothetical protein